MKTKDVVIGLIVVVLLVTAVLVYKNRKTPAPKVTSPTPNYQQVETKFPGLKIPTNADRANLSDISGGSGIGEAFRTYEGGKFNLTIMANLPDGAYQAWLINAGGSKINLGNLTSEKGGYIVNFSSGTDLTTYKHVLVTKNNLNILEGSF